jgi:hypothetical protein
MLRFVNLLPLELDLFLLDSCLSVILSYYMAMFILNKTFIGKMGEHIGGDSFERVRRKMLIVW